MENVVDAVLAGVKFINMLSVPLVNLIMTNFVGCPKVRSIDLGAVLRTSLFAGVECSNVACPWADPKIMLHAIPTDSKKWLNFIMVPYEISLKKINIGQTIIL